MGARVLSTCLQNWDGSGGNGAALRHFEATGSKYPLVVKLGTITPHGADVFSYAPDENDMVEDPKLVSSYFPFAAYLAPNIKPMALTIGFKPTVLNQQALVLFWHTFTCHLRLAMVPVALQQQLLVSDFVTCCLLPRWMHAHAAPGTASHC